MRHLRLWRACWSVLAAIGVGLAILEWSGVAVVVTLWVLVGIAWLLRTLVFPDGALAPGRATRLAGLVVSRPLPVSMGIVAVGAVGAVSPTLAVAAAATAVVTSPVAFSRIRRAPVRAASPTREALPEAAEPEDYSLLSLPQPPSPLEGLDDRQLCRLWRESFWDLGGQAPPAALLRTVLVRQACLDELERRDACALQAWLDSGARASGGPEKFMARRGRGGPEAA